MLRRHNLPRTGVVHGFAGSYQQAEAFIKLGYYIGVGGTITYPRASKTRQVMARLPLASLLLETDAPDMPLAGFQGQPNRPERLPDTFQVLCSLREEPPQLIAESIYRNSQTLFALPPSNSV
jgi:TatD DNase family protein